MGSIAPLTNQQSRLRRTSFEARFPLFKHKVLILKLNLYLLNSRLISVEFHVIESITLHSHSIDLLAAVSCECFSELVGVSEDATLFQYEGHDMSVIEAIANFLHQRIEQVMIENEN